MVNLNWSLRFHLLRHLWPRYLGCLSHSTQKLSAGGVNFPMMKLSSTPWVWNGHHCSLSVVVLLSPARTSGHLKKATLCLSWNRMKRFEHCWMFMITMVASWLNNRMSSSRNRWRFRSNPASSRNGWKSWYSRELWIFCFFEIMLLGACFSIWCLFLWITWSPYICFSYMIFDLKLWYSFLKHFHDGHLDPRIGSFESSWIQ